MKHIALLASAGFLALTGATQASDIQRALHGAQPATTQCRPDASNCATVLSLRLCYRNRCY